MSTSGISCDAESFEIGPRGTLLKMEKNEKQKRVSEDLTQVIPTIKSANVEYSYGTGESEKQVLFDNNLIINPGEIVIMTGPSGSQNDLANTHWSVEVDAKR